MKDITLTQASFVSLWVETLLYGAYAVLYFICMYILLYRRGKNTPPNMPMIITATAIFLLSTTHVIVGLVRGLQAFIDSPEGALGYYEQIWNWLSIFKQAIYATENIISDGLVVYRCYVVWGRSWKIIVIPIIMLTGTTVCGYLAVYNFSQVHPGENVFVSNIAQWGTALFSLSLATNIIVTTLIASRIWWLSRSIRSYLGRRHMVKYNQAMAIIIESGAIYSASLMTLLILYCSKTNSQYIVYDALAQIMGIVPTLIIVRIGLGISTQDGGTTFATTLKGDNSRNPGPGSSNHHGSNHAVNLPIMFRRVIETETETSTRFGDRDLDQYGGGPKKDGGYSNDNHSSGQVVV